MQRTHFFMGLGLVLASLFLPQPAQAQSDRGFQRGNGGAQIILYSETNFRGVARAYNGDVETLSRDGFNDVARSAEIRGGTWTLCKDRGGRGRCQTIGRSIADLGQIGLDCELTSFFHARNSSSNGFGGNNNRDGFNRSDRSDRSRGQGRSNRNSFNQQGRGGTQYAPVTLFSKDDFRGRSVGISGAVNLRDVGFNDKADSISISQGRWIVCTGRNLEGRCDVLGRSVYDLDDIDLDDNISSIAPYNGRRQY